jgi:DNA-binding MarR family transcriptional regulator
LSIRIFTPDRKVLTTKVQKLRRPSLDKSGDLNTIHLCTNDLYSNSERADMNTDELYAIALEIRILAANMAKMARRAMEQRPELADASISGLQFGILHILSFKEQTITELSRKFTLDPSTLVPTVDALERKGLVKRGRDPSDRRRVPLSLTEEGGRLASLASVIDENDLLVQSLRAMGDEPARQLLALLRDLLAHMPEGEEILHHVSSRVRLQTAND